MDNRSHVEAVTASWEILLGHQSPLQEEAGAADFALQDNILLQLVLPVTLFLAFLILTQLKILQNKETLLNSLLGAINNETLVEAVVDLQKQKIIAAIEKVKNEERKALYIDAFQERGVLIKDGKLHEELFQRLCEKTYEVLNTEHGRKREAEGLYQRVLAVATLQPSSLLPENETFLRQHLQEFLQGLVDNVVYIQHRTIREFFDYYLTLSPEQLDQHDPQLKYLRELYSKAQGDQRAAQAARLYNHLHETLKKNLDQQRYRFLEATWQALRL